MSSPLSLFKNSERACVSGAIETTYARKLRPDTTEPSTASVLSSIVRRSLLSWLSSGMRVENTTSRTSPRIMSYDRAISSSSASSIACSTSVTQRTASTEVVHQSLPSPRKAVGATPAGMTCHARMYSSSLDAADVLLMPPNHARRNQEWLGGAR